MSSDEKKDKKERKLLEKIEKQLDRIARRQDEICGRIERLESGGATSSSARRGISRDELVTFLDQFRAGEALGEASLGAWIEVSDLACVRGGLRTVQQREGMHARLLEARIKALGCSPTFELPDAVYERTMKDAGNAEKGDAQKVADFVARFPDIDSALRPIHDVIARIEDDDETRFLLHTIVQDERSTLEFFQEAAELLCGGEQ
jgi:DNA-binding ferritin-like protein